MMIFPQKLAEGSHVRVIAPARSLALIDKDRRAIAQSQLQDMGLKVSFGRHVEESDIFNSSSIQSRIEDLHEAFADNSVNGILTVIGGYNSNQILQSIDYDLVRQNPKILCGYSDITVLSHAILCKTNLVTYSGPHFSSFSMKLGFQYTKDYFRKCLFECSEYLVQPALEWSDDEWYLNQDCREFIKNSGPKTLRQDNINVTGRALGGNLAAICTLQGTEFFPQLRGCILFVEADNEMTPELFDRQLQGLLHQEGARHIGALLIGRLQKGSLLDDDTLRLILESKQELVSIPVVYNLDFGHTSPMFTFPIGGSIQIIIKDGKTNLKILGH